MSAARRGRDRADGLPPERLTLGHRHVPVLSRRQVLGTGAAALALASVPRAARAATLRRATEPQSRPQESRVLASLNGTWDFMPTSGTPAAPPSAGTWSSIPVPAEWNMTAGNFATAWGAYDLFETPASWDSVDVAWYRRTVDVPASQRGQRIVLRFEAVNFEATVFWNGTRVAYHAGGPAALRGRRHRPGQLGCDEHRSCPGPVRERGRPAVRRMALSERILVGPDLLGYLAGRLAARPPGHLRPGQLRHHIGKRQADKRNDHDGQ